MRASAGVCVRGALRAWQPGEGWGFERLSRRTYCRAGRCCGAHRPPGRRKGACGGEGCIEAASHSVGGGGGACGGSRPEGSRGSRARGSCIPIPESAGPRSTAIAELWWSSPPNELPLFAPSLRVLEPSQLSTPSPAPSFLSTGRPKLPSFYPHFRASHLSARACLLEQKMDACEVVIEAITPEQLASLAEQPKRVKWPRYESVTLANREAYFAASCAPITKISEDDMELLSDVFSELNDDGFGFFWEEGSYYCARCALPLFHSVDKWKGPCRWASFRRCTSNVRLRAVYDYNNYTCATEEAYCEGCQLFIGHRFQDALAKGDDPNLSTGFRI